MLVLSRSLGQRLFLSGGSLGDDEIEVAVLRISSSAVRIGIEAPKDMRIVREEVRNLAGWKGKSEERT